MAYDQRTADLEYELGELRRINSELNAGNNDLNQLVLDTQRERDDARAELAKTISNFEEFAEAVSEERRIRSTLAEETHEQVRDVLAERDALRAEVDELHARLDATEQELDRYRLTDKGWVASRTVPP
jgi:phage shock protein A